MSRVPRITRETIRKLERIYDEADTKIASGYSIKEAFAELAKKYDLTKEQVKLLINGRNITNVLDKLASTMDLNERLMTLYEHSPIHSDEILHEHNVKKANEVSIKYLLPPKEVNNRVPLIKDEFFEKYAKLDISNQRNEIIESKVFDKNKYRLQKELEKLAGELSTLKTKLDIEKVQLKKLLSASTEPLTVIVSNMKVAYPGSEKLIIGLNIKQNPLIEKKATYYSETKSPYKEIINCYKTSQEFSKTVKKIKDLIKSAKSDAFLSKKPELNEDDLEKLCVGNIQVKKKAFTEKLGTDYSERKDRDRDRKSRDSRDVKLKDTREIRDLRELAEETRKSFEEVRRSKIEKFENDLAASFIPEITRTYAHVASLILSDPILSNYDPRDVYKAYKEIYNIAPGTMQNDATAKALLRKVLAQGGVLDIYDIKTLSDIERKIPDRST